MLTVSYKFPRSFISIVLTNILGMTEFTGWGDWFQGLFSRANLLIHNMYAVDPNIHGDPEVNSFKA